MLAALSKADRNLARLAEVGNAFPVPYVVARTFARKEAVLSSRIEGTRTSFEELLSYEAGQFSTIMNQSKRLNKVIMNLTLKMDYATILLTSYSDNYYLIK